MRYEPFSAAFAEKISTRSSEEFSLAFAEFGVCFSVFAFLGAFVQIYFFCDILDTRCLKQ